MSAIEQLKKLRLSLCLNQKEFAQQVGIPISSISHYESGTRKPGFSSIRKLMAFAKKNGIKLTIQDIRDDL
jgi:predicted transcriptional regulator